MSAKTTRSPGPKKPSLSSPRGRGALPSKKLAISFEGALARQVHRAAELEARGNVSAWLAEAARRRLRQSALASAVAAYEAEHGAITADELAEVRRQWPPG